MDFTDQAFWIAVLQIIAIDIVLGGDNAVVIALASRRLPEKQRKLAILWGVAGAIGLRVVLIFFALYLLAIPYLKTVGALLLLWIGVKLLLPEDEGEGEGIDASTTLVGAIKTIVVADAVMSLDNVIAIAGAAKGSLGLVIFGLVVSVPIIVWGSKLVLKLMDRFPIVIVAGGALLGWIAGDMMVTDVALADWFKANVPGASWLAPVVGALFVIVLGKWLASRAKAKVPAYEIGTATHGAAGAPIAAVGAGAGETAGERAPGGLAPPAAGGASSGATARGAFFKSILLPVDASDNAARAVEYAVELRRQLSQPEAVAIHVLNVQRPVSGDVSTFVAKDAVQDYHREKSEEALRRPLSILDGAGVKYTVHMLVGTPWDAICEYAAQQGCDHIIMGTRGLGTYTGAALGSVAMGVIQNSPVPVIVIK